MQLLQRLTATADRWVEEQRRTNRSITLKTLATRAVGDAKLFERLKKGGSINVKTFEAVMGGYFADPDNWPAGIIPKDVVKTLVDLGADIEVQRPLPLNGV